MAHRISAAPALAARLLGAAVAAAALAGCGGAHYAASDPVIPGDYRERHPIVVASAPTTLDVYPVGGALDQRSLHNIHAFAQRYRRYGAGAMTIDTPPGVGANSPAVRAVRQALVGAGFDGRVDVSAYAPPDDGAAPPIRVSYIGVKAIVATPCGQWPDDLASGSSVDGWRNESYPNFGCATQAMMAAQVDDPRDFIEPHALGPSDVAMRMRAIQSVRNGQDPGTDWKHAVLIPIGNSGVPDNGN